MALGYFGPQGIRFAGGAPAYHYPVLVESSPGVKASLFNDENGLNPAPNPKNTDQYGNLYFYVAAGHYELVVNGARVPIDVDEAPSGGGGGVAGTAYTHTQSTASTVWDVVHNLGFDPAGIYVEDSQSNIWHPDATYLVSGTTLRLTFAESITGVAQLS